uniref:Uncharacterized protein n=1 Tax=Timema bartmani TaxID=61472 RepID=A0A7R9F7E9_9NEOP|nr:unnamed protein product [Timema bartmani]
MKRLGATFSNGGALRHEFDFKGVVEAIKPANLSLEIATDHAIEVGAEDVMQINLSNNLPGLQLFTRIRVSKWLALVIHLLDLSSHLLALPTSSKVLNLR